MTGGNNEHGGGGGCSGVSVRIITPEVVSYKVL